ncbi:unnamed protein product [Lupinus luteus]|uniref:Uncharacterized protein n=1 Tax=Lupinus luteus TaxID=3873 RepID=A0AAV1Y6L0_LUPLU
MEVTLELGLSFHAPDISPKDIQWVKEDPGINQRGAFGGSDHGMNRPVGRDSVPGSGRGRGAPKGQSRKDFLSSQNGIERRVERVFSANNLDPFEIEDAKKDHEQALIDAIARLADLSDGESGTSWF